MLKKTLKILVGVSIIYLLLFLFIWQIRDYTYQFLYDSSNEIPNIYEQSQVDEILATFKTIKIAHLDESFKEKSKIQDPEYLNMHEGAFYYLVMPKDIYRKIAGSVRIKDIVSRDEFYISSIMDRSKPIYLRIDKRLLYKIIELVKKLEENGYSGNGFKVHCGYRTPSYNENVGGASRSRHIKGEAVDMTIYDINKDGKYTNVDKQIIVDLLEKEIIKGQGGIGLYPGTNIVHMDVRGYHARWDTY